MSTYDVAEVDRQMQPIHSLLDGLAFDAAMAAAVVIEGEIRLRVPVLTGKLRESLVKKSRRREAAASVVIEMPHSGPDGTEHYAIFQEFGTSKMPAHPYMRPGFEAGKEAAIHEAEAVINQKLKEFQ
jgi:HK97 gp10 family phage protein